jgi:hypothetical protein
MRVEVEVTEITSRKDDQIDRVSDLIF